MNTFRQRTISGVIWSATSQFGRQVLNVGIGIVLAHLLSPREFGLVAMVTVLTSFAGIFGELGFSAALVQKQDVRQEHLSSIFWLNLIMGLLLTLLFMAGAPLIAGFYGEPLLIPLTMLVSLNFLISSFSIVQSTLLPKALDFRRLSRVGIAAVAVSGSVSVLMAYAGFGVWSLAAESLVASAVTTMLLWRLSPWRPTPAFDWAATRELLGFSSFVFGSKLLNYWVRNLDYLLIGRFLGTNPLGFYSRSYTIMLLPLANVSRVVSGVMFPALSIIREDKRRVRNVFLRMTRSIALVTFPMMLGLFVTVEPFVLTLFGPRWSEMIPLLRLFSLLGMIQSIGQLGGDLFLSQGRADLEFKLGLVLRAVPLLGITIGLRWGIMGVAVGYATAYVVCWYPGFYFGGRLVNLTFFELLKNLSGVFGCAVAMAGAVWALGQLLPTGWPHWVYLAVQVPSGALIYLGLIRLLKIPAYQEVRSLMLEQWRLYRGSFALKKEGLCHPSRW